MANKKWIAKFPDNKDKEFIIRGESFFIPNNSIIEDSEIVKKFPVFFVPLEEENLDQISKEETKGEVKEETREEVKEEEIREEVKEEIVDKKTYSENKAKRKSYFYKKGEDNE